MHSERRDLFLSPSGAFRNDYIVYAIKNYTAKICTAALNIETEDYHLSFIGCEFRSQSSGGEPAIIEIFDELRF